MRRRVSEDSSEKSKRPGRPRRLTATDEALVSSLYPGRTRRTLMEKSYVGRAIAVLGLQGSEVEEPFRWLFGAGVVRSTILAELGRIEDEELLRTVAAEVCKSRLSARTARERIRWVRTGRQTTGSWLELSASLEDTLNRYLAGHPNVTLADAEKAVESLLEGVREAATGENT